MWPGFVGIISSWPCQVRFGYLAPFPGEKPRPDGQADNGDNAAQVNTRARGSGPDEGTGRQAVWFSTPAGALLAKIPSRREVNTSTHTWTMTVRICAFTNLYLPDCAAGAQTMFRDLLRPLRDAGHQIEVAIHRPGKRILPYEWEGIMVYPWVNRRSAIAHITSADVCLTTLEATDRACALGDIFDIPIVQIIHNDRWGTVERIRKRCDLAVFNSRWVRKALAKEIHGPDIIVHPPVDPADYTVPPRRRGAVTLVNLWPDKGSATFYAAAEALPELSFLGVRGGYGEQDIRELPNVEHLPQTQNITNDVYARTRVLLMPSSYESWGRCAVEAAQSGIPTIAHPTPGLTEALGHAGIFVDRDDHDGWVREIRRLQNPRWYGEARKRALARAGELEVLRVRQLQSWVAGVEYAATRKRSAS